MDVIYCKKCHERKRIKKYESAIEEIKTNLGVEEVDNVCMSYCGPGKKEHFIVIDDEIIANDTYDGLIEDIKEYHGN